MRRSWIQALAVAGAAMLGLTACASGSVSGGNPAPTSSAGAGGSAALTKVTVGLWPSSAVAAFELGKQEGIFAKHGVDLEIVLGQGSAAHLPAVSSGAMDFMVASPITPLTATQRGLDVKIVSGYARNNPDVADDSTVVVSKKEDIKRPKDLAGKRVSINALGSIGEIGIKEAVELDGGDPNTIEFVQLGLNEVAAQLDGGQIDAGMTGMPFTQAIVASGGHLVSDFIKEAGLGNAELVVVGGGKTLADKPEVTKNFVAALAEALPYANANQDKVRALLPAMLGTKPEVAEKLVFMDWNADLDEAAIGRFADLMAKFKIVDAKPDVAQAVWKP